MLKILHRVWTIRNQVLVKWIQVRITYVLVVFPIRTKARRFSIITTNLAKKLKQYVQRASAFVRFVWTRSCRRASWLQARTSNIDHNNHEAGCFKETAFPNCKYSHRGAANRAVNQARSMWANFVLPRRRNAHDSRNVKRFISFYRSREYPTQMGLIKTWHRLQISSSLNFMTATHCDDQEHGNNTSAYTVAQIAFLLVTVNSLDGVSLAYEVCLKDNHGERSNDTSQHSLAINCQISMKSFLPITK